MRESANARQKRKSKNIIKIKNLNEIYNCAYMHKYISLTQLICYNSLTFMIHIFIMKIIIIIKSVDIVGVKCEMRGQREVRICQGRVSFKIFLLSSSLFTRCRLFTFLPNFTFLFRIHW
jgi:hypothetical protein